MMQGVATQEQTSQQRKETRQIVTPYRFSVSQELIGTALGSPIRRAMALLIDLVLVAMLTNVSSVFLAGLVAIVFFRAGNRLKQKKRFNGIRIILRFLAALMLFLFAIGIIDEFQDHARDGLKGFDSKNEISQVDNSESLEGGAAIEALAHLAKYMMDISQVKNELEQGTCERALDCWDPLNKEVAAYIAQMELTTEEQDGLKNGYLGLISDTLSEQELADIGEQMDQTIGLASNEGGLTQNEVSPAASSLPNVAEQVMEETGVISEDKPSLLDWIEGTAKDMGIGFGWAAFYFSVLTVWLHGATPGKKLLGLKIVKLDGQQMSLWESFGRYGGYGAGLATGLGGFAQIFWDPNRQAIQDKISETLVIDTRKPKRTLDTQ